MESLQQVHEIIGNTGYINHLPFYPEEDLYLVITLLLIPFKIERGHDEFIYGHGKNTKKSQRHLWYVARNDIQYPPLYIEKGFKTLKNAINALCEQYQKELQVKMLKHKEFKDVFLQKSIENAE